MTNDNIGKHSHRPSNSGHIHSPLEDGSAHTHLPSDSTTITEQPLRVWHIQNPPNEPTWYIVDSPAAGARKIAALAEADLHNRAVWGNAFGLSVLEDGDWVDWYDAEGNDLDTWAEKNGVPFDENA